MKTKQGLLKAVNQEIQQLRVLAASIEASDEPDLHPITELASVLEKRRQNLGLKPHEVAELCGLSANTYRAMDGARQRQPHDQHPQKRWPSAQLQDLDRIDMKALVKMSGHVAGILERDGTTARFQYHKAYLQMRQPQFSVSLPVSPGHQ